MKKNLTTAGFTLVETLVAILILSMAIVGPLSIASRGLGAALISKDQTVAFFLAQDAVEYVRYRRDSNRLAGNADSLAGLDGSGGCTTSDGCTVDSIADSVSPCGGASCVPMNYDSSKHYFTYGSGTATPFTRTVKIKTDVCGSGGTGCNSDESDVTVTISWHDVGGQPHTVRVQEELFNWQ